MIANSHNALVSSDHDLYVCGGNTAGELGLGMVTPFEPAFKKVTQWFPAEDVKCPCVPYNCTCSRKHENYVTAVSCGKTHIAAINNGALYMCGKNFGGGSSSLGLTNYDANVTVFSRVTTGLPQNIKVKQISAAFDYTMVVMEDGSLWVCGINIVNIGNLGLGSMTASTVSSFTKVNLPANLKVLQVSTGNFSAAIICNNGERNSLYTCGENLYGQLGLGNLTNMAVFTLVTLGYPQNLNPVSVSINNHMIVLFDNGSIYTCGSNTNGELGVGTLISSSVLVPANVGLPPEAKVIAVSAGNNYTDVILESGTLYACGANDLGQLGLGTGFDASNEPAFKQVTFGIKDYRVVEINAAFAVNNIMLSNGDVYTCGVNDQGVLGQGNQNTSLPESLNSILTPISYATTGCCDISVLTLSDWAPVFLVDLMNVDRAKLTNKCKTLQLISNYQKYEVIISDRSGKHRVCKDKFVSSLCSKLFKKHHSYKIQIVNSFNNDLIAKFKVCC